MILIKVKTKYCICCLSEIHRKGKKTVCENWVSTFLARSKSIICKVHGNVFGVIILKFKYFWNMAELLNLNCFSDGRSLQSDIYF